MGRHKYHVVPGTIRFEDDKCIEIYHLNSKGKANITDKKVIPDEVMHKDQGAFREDLRLTDEVQRPVLNQFIFAPTENDVFDLTRDEQSVFMDELFYNPPDFYA